MAGLREQQDMIMEQIEKYKVEEKAAEEKYEDKQKQYEDALDMNDHELVASRESAWISAKEQLEANRTHVKGLEALLRDIIPRECQLSFSLRHEALQLSSLSFRPTALCVCSRRN